MISQRWNRWLDKLGLRVSSLDALLHLAMLAIPVGLLSGGVIIGFRLLVESIQGQLLPQGEIENYEALAWPARLLLATLRRERGDETGTEELLEPLRRTGKDPDAFMESFSQRWAL